MWGFTMEEATPSVDVWPDNWRPALLFNAIGTQWRSGFSGAYGLDYNVLFSKLDRMHLSELEYDELEEDIRIMEDAALATMRERVK